MGQVYCSSVGFRTGGSYAGDVEECLKHVLEYSGVTRHHVQPALKVQEKKKIMGLEIQRSR